MARNFESFCLDPSEITPKVVKSNSFNKDLKKEQAWQLMNEHDLELIRVAPVLDKAAGSHTN